MNELKTAVERHNKEIIKRLKLVMKNIDFNFNYRFEALKLFIKLTNGS